MRLKVYVEEGESTLHKLQRPLSSRGAGLQGNIVRYILHPGITGASGGKRRMGDNVAGDRSTDNDKHHGKHVNEDTQRGGVVCREDEVGRRFYMKYFQTGNCFGKYATSVSGARLTALGARLHTSCL